MDNIYENKNLRVAIFWDDDETLSDEFETHAAAEAFLAESDRPGHVVGYQEGEQEEVIDFSKEFNHPYFKHGMDIGESIGAHRTLSMAERAHEMGELELWLEAMRAKSMEEWEEWDEKYGRNFSDRWKNSEDE